MDETPCATMDDQSYAKTIHAALVDLNIRKSVFRIHILGADSLECSSPFERFNFLLHHSNYIDAVFELFLVGPNVGEQPSIYSNRHSVNFLSGFYHDLNVGKEAPDLVVCFHAGVWAYPNWKDSLVKAVHYCPVLITSYNIFEAEDDNDALVEMGFKDFIWGEKRNPHASLVSVISPECHDPPRLITENEYWQCLSKVT